MKFKVGDKVKGISYEYNITNKDMYLGEIIGICTKTVEIKVLKHKNRLYVGKKYYAPNPEGKFEIVKNKNRKFFKKLPNDFTGTLEVENGYIVEKEILDDVEKEYLKNVIKPFKSRIKCISKETSCIGNHYIFIDLGSDDVALPSFSNKTMYKGMEADKEYTLKELGLDE